MAALGIWTGFENIVIVLVSLRIKPANARKSVLMLESRKALGIHNIRGTLGRREGAACVGRFGRNGSRGGSTHFVVAVVDSHVGQACFWLKWACGVSQEYGGIDRIISCTSPIRRAPES